MTRSDTFEGDMDISYVSEEIYLGQKISSDGKNTTYIEKIRNRGIGLQNNIIQMLETMPGGHFHFEIVKIYRNAYIISSILSSSEIWYGTIQHELEILEQVDEMWI